MYYLSLTKQQLDSFSKHDNINECVMNIITHRIISYYKETINNPVPRYLSHNCDIICFDSDIELDIHGYILKLHIAKPYLICIPIISLQYSDIVLHTLNKDITTYHIYLDNVMRRELACNPWHFSYIHNFKFQFYTSSREPSIDFPKYISPLLRVYRSTDDRISTFNSKMQRIANILMNRNNLDYKKKIVLFLLRHHAVPPENTMIPCATILS